MLILKRLLAWSLETLCAALLLGILLYVLWGPASSVGEHSVGRAVLHYAALTVVVFMFGSGYLLTTAAAGIVLRERNLWLYPAVAAILFVVHLQFYSSGWTPAQKLPIQGFGACIVFVCAFTGELVLRKWVRYGKNAG